METVAAPNSMPIPWNSPLFQNQSQLPFHPNMRMALRCITFASSVIPHRFDCGATSSSLRPHLCHRGRSPAFPPSSSQQPSRAFTMSEPWQNPAVSANDPATAAATTTTEADVVSALSAVRTRIQAVAPSADSVQLVAVSKTKPVALVRAAYDAGQRLFGENYVQELVTKHTELPSDIAWHFIGPLQSNKAKLLLSVPNLAVVESVDREKTATALEKAAAASRTIPLDVMVQVNTSGEASKSGAAPGDGTVQLARCVTQMQHLKLVGLMTIGAPGDTNAFTVLAQQRDMVAEALSYPSESLKLSMGMSGDFEEAIKLGSNSVRVGSTIFGARDYSKRS